jgi:hypothetical protein
MSYEDFLAGKALVVPPTGITKAVDLAPGLFPHQRDLVSWALRRGRAALFADCGMGKAFMALEWSRHIATETNGRVLILAPLAVAKQFEREGEKFGIPVRYVREQSQIDGPISVTNYEMLSHFDASLFAGVVCDESSILKSLTGKFRNQLIDSFRNTPFKLACTATPAPNDFVELGNHAEFLGILTHSEMLATFFVHDGGETQTWRLKGHAQDDFWKWICSWAAMVRSPSDLGHDAGSYVLPELRYHETIVSVDPKDAFAAGRLFANEATTLADQRAARRMSLVKRVAAAAEIANAATDPVLIYCDLNDEGDALEEAIPDAVQVAGADTPEDKEERLFGFAEGRHRVLISKPKVAGFGMNFQVCAKVIFVGLSHSYEALYQSVRRCYRFGQTRPVDVYLITSEAEGAVLQNVKRKEVDAARMSEGMLAHMREIQRAEIQGSARANLPYLAKRQFITPSWLTSETAA